MVNKGKLLKKFVVAGLTATMVFGSASAAFADGRGHNKHEQKNNASHYKQQLNLKVNGKHGKVDIKLHFKDLNQKDYEWVMENIARLSSKRVFEGYEDGTFRPKRTITRIEAIIAAVRLMGLREQAESAEEMATKLNFTDADKIVRKYPNAVGYVAVALENDLFSEADNSVQPEKAADRLWATTLLVKALKLEDEAKAKMNTDLDFRDAKQIPAGSVGYVAVAIEKKLIFGYNDNTFKPNKPVTRAELAALLDRTGDQMPDYDSNTIAGTVNSAIASNVLTLTKEGQTVQLAVDPNAFVFRNGTKALLSDIQAGDQVEVRTYNNVVVFIEVTNTAIENTSFNGTINSIVDANNAITIRKDNQDVRFTIDSNALIYRNGSITAASELRIGDQVFVRTENNKIVFIQVINTVSEDITFTGNIKTIVDSDTITFSKDNQDVQYNVDADAFIYRKGTSVNVSGLKVGDEVFVRIEDGEVIFLQVTKAIEDEQNFTVNGLFQSLTLNSAGQIATISVSQSVYGGTQVSIYNVASDVTITGNTANLTLNRPIELTGKNQVVTTIKIP